MNILFTIQDYKLVGKDKDQLRFDVVMSNPENNEALATFKGYRLMGGKVCPPMARVGSGGFYTVVSWPKLESFLTNELIEDRKLHELFPNIQFPVRGKLANMS